MERNQTIDLLKFIFSLCVIAIHVSLFKNINTALYHITTMGLMRIAVPFFFITSGYYYYQRINQNIDSRLYIVQLLKTFVIFEGIELLIYTIPMFSYIKEYGILLYLWRALSVGLGGAYWYITSLMISLMILTPLWKKKKLFPFLIIGFILYLCVFTNDSYSMIFENSIIQNIAMIHTRIWTWPQAGLCSSLFYLSIGALIDQYRPQLKLLNVIFIVSFIGLMIESFILQGHGAKDGNCYISLIFVTPLLFLITLEHSHLPFDTKTLGQMSLYNYMVHPIVLSILRFLIPYLNNNNELLLIIAMFITLFISYYIVKRKKVC